MRRYENGSAKICGAHVFSNSGTTAAFVGEWKNTVYAPRIGGFKTSYWNKNHLYPFSKRKTCIVARWCRLGSCGKMEALRAEFKNSLLLLKKVQLFYKMGTKSSVHLWKVQEGFGVLPFSGGRRRLENDEKTAMVNFREGAPS